eukprot:2484177-Lingulodinium_polyedra.AAC.1
MTVRQHSSSHRVRRLCEVVQNQVYRLELLQASAKPRGWALAPADERTDGVLQKGKTSSTLR